MLFLVLLLAFQSPGAAAETALPENPGTGTLWMKTSATAPYTPALQLNTDYRVQVGAMLADTLVSQSFRNTRSEAAEGIYVFPLPDDAAVYAMDMRVGERLIEGRIRERQQARKAYEQARDRGESAALVAQQRPNLFTTRIANIAPGETVEVRLRYQQQVDYQDGQFELSQRPWCRATCLGSHYRLPLATSSPIPGKGVGPRPPTR